MTEKETIVIKLIEQRCKGWGFNNFQIERTENDKFEMEDIVFSMEQDSQSFDGKIKLFFVSKHGTLFCFYQNLTEIYERNSDNSYTKKIEGDYFSTLSALYLHIFAQICDILDGLLYKYYIK